MGEGEGQEVGGEGVVDLAGKGGGDIVDQTVDMPNNPTLA